MVKAKAPSRTWYTVEFLHPTDTNAAKDPARYTLCVFYLDDVPTVLRLPTGIKRGVGVATIFGATEPAPNEHLYSAKTAADALKQAVAALQALHPGIAPKVVRVRR